MTKKRDMITNILIVIVAFFMAITWNELFYSNMHFQGLSYIITILIKTIIISLFLFVLLYAFTALIKRSNVLDNDREYSKKKDSVFNLTWNKKSVIYSTLVLSSISLIYLIIYFPGTCNWDTINEIYDFTTKNAALPYSWISGQPTVSALMNDHHPVFDTIIFTNFYKIGVFFKCPNFGLFLYNLIQVFLTAFSLSIMICSISKWGENTLLIRRISFGFVVLYPPIHFYSICMVKDSLFAFIFVIYLTYYCLIVLDNTTKKRIFVIIITSILLALTKKTGVYIILICNISLLVLSIKTYGKKYVLHYAASIIIPSFIIFVLFVKILFPIFNIYPGGKQESIGFALQQVSQVVVDKKPLSKNELKTIDEVIPIKKINKCFNPKTIDGIKNHFNFHATEGALSDFKILWMKLFFRYPKSYIKATMNVCGAFFVPSESISVYYQIPPDGNNKTLQIHNPNMLKNARTIANNIYDFLCNYPGISLMFSMALYCWIIPLLAFLYCLKHNYIKRMFCFIPIIVSILTLVVSPLAYGRYIIVFLYVTPLMFGLLSEQKNNN